VRLFFAAWPPPETAAALHEWSKALQGRATPAERIHLTLAFLGEGDPVNATAAGRAVRARRLELLLDEARYVKRNEMVWAVAREAPMQLVESLHANLAGAGFVLEKRPYAAHVTLLRKAPAPGALPTFPRVAWPVDKFLLVRSSGSKYEPLARFPLSK
jgi:RNA 2',3'-cyclic 3'-phosphodiesterase